MYSLKRRQPCNKTYNKFMYLDLRGVGAFDVSVVVGEAR